MKILNKIKQYIKDNKWDIATWAVMLVLLTIVYSVSLGAIKGFFAASFITALAIVIKTVFRKIGGR